MVTTVLVIMIIVGLYYLAKDKDDNDDGPSLERTILTNESNNTAREMKSSNIIFPLSVDNNLVRRGFDNQRPTVFFNVDVLDLDNNSLKLIEETLTTYPQIQLIITSDRRTSVSDQYFFEKYSLLFDIHVMGATPKLHSLHEELKSFIKMHDVNKYIVVDNDKSRVKRIKNTIIANAYNGITVTEINKLTKWITNEDNI